jgi:bla regulator protein blaR1
LQRRKDDPAGPSQELVVQKNSIPRFTEYLSRQFDQPVIDKTGLQGDFSFSLHWVPDVNPSVSRLDVFGPAGIHAIEDQLGLKMEPARTPIEVPVIDHVERIPAEN